VHHQAAQEGTKLVQMLWGELVNLFVIMMQIAGLIPEATLW
jgi:hypothetical protein